MTVTARMSGRDVRYDEGIARWLWEDTGKPAYIGDRPCPRCGLSYAPCDQCDEPLLHDPCIGHIEGVNSACCGHGVETGYIVWDTT